MLGEEIRYVSPDAGAISSKTSCRPGRANQDSVRLQAKSPTVSPIPMPAPFAKRSDSSKVRPTSSWANSIPTPRTNGKPRARAGPQSSPSGRTASNVRKAKTPYPTACASQSRSPWGKTDVIEEPGGKRLATPKATVHKQSAISRAKTIGLSVSASLAMRVFGRATGDRSFVIHPPEASTSGQICLRNDAGRTPFRVLTRGRKSRLIDWNSGLRTRPVSVAAKRGLKSIWTSNSRVRLRVRLSGTKKPRRPQRAGEGLDELTQALLDKTVVSLTICPWTLFALKHPKEHSHISACL